MGCIANSCITAVQILASRRGTGPVFSRQHIYDCMKKVVTMDLQQTIQVRPRIRATNLPAQLHCHACQHAILYSSWCGLLCHASTATKRPLGDVDSCLIVLVALLQLGDDFEATAYYAGHVLGAAIIHVRVGSESVVYTGMLHTCILSTAANYKNTCAGLWFLVMQLQAV